MKRKTWKYLTKRNDCRNGNTWQKEMTRKNWKYLAHNSKGEGEGWIEKSSSTSKEVWEAIRSTLGKQANKLQQQQQQQHNKNHTQTGGGFDGEMDQRVTSTTITNNNNNNNKHKKYLTQEIGGFDGERAPSVRKRKVPKASPSTALIQPHILTEFQFQQQQQLSTTSTVMPLIHPSPFCGKLS